MRKWKCQLCVYVYTSGTVQVNQCVSAAIVYHIDLMMACRKEISDIHDTSNPTLHASHHRNSIVLFVSVSTYRFSFFSFAIIFSHGFHEDFYSIYLSYICVALKCHIISFAMYLYIVVPRTIIFISLFIKFPS